MTAPPLFLERLPTPTALVDLPRLQANCRRMAERADRLGVRLRPHVKTHKTAEVARLQLAGRATAITVSTLAEARFFADQGVPDITYAVPIAPHRLPAALELVRRLERFTLTLDHPRVAAAAEEAAAAAGLRLGVMLEVDCGAHRSGVDPASPEAVALAAQVAASPHLELRGLLTHAGHAYACRSLEEVAAVAGQEREVTVALARALRQAGITVGEVSVGSTPTLCAVDHLTGVDEVRPGNYVFFDAFQAAMGSCALEECAFTVLATVVGCYPGRRTLVVDAGALALSKDAGPTHLDPHCGFGVVCSAAECRPLPDLRLASLTQEHGTVRVRTPQAAAAFPPGSRLRIIPNHSCLAAACFDLYHVVDGERVLDLWRPCRGW